MLLLPPLPSPPHRSSPRPQLHVCRGQTTYRGWGEEVEHQYAGVWGKGNLFEVTEGCKGDGTSDKARCTAA